MDARFYESFIGLMVFCFGICFGSFLNVCIHRWPREESVVSPGSHCPKCEKEITWYDNLPLVSFLLLGARCRNCGVKITWRYFFIELLTGLIWVACWLAWGLTWKAGVAVLLFTVLLGITITDFETQLIPDKFTLPMIAAGLVLSAVFPELHAKSLWYEGLGTAAAAMLIGGGILLLTGLLGNFLFKKESMGGGDIKLLAMLGTFIGIKSIILVFLLGPIVALPFALYSKFVYKEEVIPFGPFLAIAGAWMFLFGEQTWNFVFALY